LVLHHQHSASQVIIKSQGDAFRNSIVDVETSDEGSIFLINGVKKVNGALHLSWQAEEPKLV
jgi:hypothetical protein